MPPLDPPLLSLFLSCIFLFLSLYVFSILLFYSVLMFLALSARDK